MTVNRLRLPLELEREIFEITAREYPEMRYLLLFVAHRVYIWILPQLYRTLFFLGYGMHPNIPGPWTSAGSVHVRHLVLSAHSHEVTSMQGDVLQVCTGVTHLLLGSSIFGEARRQAFVKLRNLRRLMCYTRGVFRASTIAAQDAVLPVFAHLTHLELMDAIANDDVVDFCAVLPSLTHLAVNGTAWPMLQKLLGVRKRLRTLISLALDLHGARAIAAAVPQGFTDTRLVFHVYDRWDEGALEGDNYWSAAEEFLEDKRNGLHKASCYITTGDGCLAK
ncbi:hypothetical protein C8F01DRAFT_1295495 [Mycena amicta]|nr:hypothetical protein C8F01DRAFT_1295495 [Mycena amicta]